MWRSGIYPRTIVLDGRLGTLRRWMRVAAGQYDVVLKSDYHAAATGMVPDFFLHHTVLQFRSPTLSTVARLHFIASIRLSAVREQRGFSSTGLTFAVGPAVRFSRTRYCGTTFMPL